MGRLYCFFTEFDRLRLWKTNGVICATPTICISLQFPVNRRRGLLVNRNLLLTEFDRLRLWRSNGVICATLASCVSPQFPVNRRRGLPR